jgi:hydroxysqualene synthase
VVSAYEYCEAIARAHYENFPVASHLLPPFMRPHVAAVYAFARLADDIADEGSEAPRSRLDALDRWDRRLQAVAAGTDDPGGPHPQVFEALRATIRDCRLPPVLLSDLLSAFKQDVTITRYATWSDLLDYCRRSANPVGRLVLRIAGYDDERIDRASDAVCTALQLTNFWQDLERDHVKGRVYLPADIRTPAGAREEDLAGRRLTPEWRTALEEAGRRTRALFEAGRSVCDAVRGRLRWELRATWLGGVRILDKLEAVHFDVFSRRPALSAATDGPVLLWQALTWRTRRPRA